ncbi:amylo-alpha-1,6-glucosidase [Burkholderia multivorans]|uniref:amylo-alpha-1,6-glucosidase n=1 Tax=Burkholderia multivorans TaxID=87883 RepID=UPI000CFF9472|nr:amylo-alpha-1,6-glucosidase [Burkholderia multivorans]MBU9143022.1 amylo-alpha-1,6-glucosidase [Burkholderia multivorans]MBU9283615.1 amylo-alpha-1,6-glucosidase [Burkholderia multivorans]MCA8337854.1 amylo-alpha-1,6-glucosidase [Burkholderia multivorans]MDN7477259.1 amylo-alpha-1,6-glucosidase [Burkholderia multivorans]MDN8007923.1 amylo-alpha-1,6-glucosidase [Burkholderia multivorans]
MANHDEATTTQAPQVAPVPPAQASGPVFIAPEADAQAPARNNQYVLKSGDAFVVSDALGDIGGHDDGLFVDDMRVLSTWRLTFGGRAPSLLSGATSADNASFTAHLTNRPLPPLGGRETPEGVIHIERMRVLEGDVLYEALTLTNYGATEAEVPLSLSFAADFKDMFEVRGTPRPKRGTIAEPCVAEGAVRMRYDGLDGVERNVTVHFSPAPDALSVDRADYTLTIAAQACVSIYLTVAATVGERPSEAPGCGRVALRTALVGVHRAMRARRETMARVRTGNPLFDAWLDRSLADLGLLTTQLDTGPYPYAGIPWFSTPFGRDAIITSLQMLWLQPSLARGVLRFLAAHQAHETSAFRDAEPGKIMHEFRRSEMAATGEVPFALYYGGVDTTPLFIVLAGAYAERTGDDALIDELWPALESAARWVIDKCDRNPYGLLDYQRTSERGLANQGWKDSHDSVFHADGRFPDGPIALVEVQAYACAALDAMAACSRRRGHSADATRYALRAKTLREQVEALFWMPESGFYGIALDGHGDLCRVLASNAGHLLAFGLPEHARGAAVAGVLGSTLFQTGWGVRTLAAGQPRFNPMAYHNGSVWPHDNALIARGLARYGDKTAAVNLLGALFEAAVSFEMRLPELFCGFPRRRGEPPTAYPVACLPQAWAAGAPFMMLQACLGVSIDAARLEVRVERPALPEGVSWLRIDDLRVGDESVSLTFRRVDGQVVAAASEPGRVNVVAVL